MAKNRMINTRIWSDGYFSNLNMCEKLLFLYFLSNQYTNISGVYEIPLKAVVSDTGISMQDVTDSIGKFSKDLKIFYKRGWIFVKNFSKHQKLNPSIVIGIDKELNLIPIFMLKLYKRHTACPQAEPSMVQTNPNENPNPKKKSNLNMNQKDNPEKWKNLFTAERETKKEV